DEIVMCTSTNPQDDILVDIAEMKKISCFRGSEDDVLDRLFNAAKSAGADFIVNVTADNPLVDPVYIDKIIEVFKTKNADYVTCKDLPLGAYAYGLKVKALETVIKTKSETDTEIWGRFFENGNIKKVEVEVEEDLRHPEIRLTVDEQVDLELMRKIFDKLHVSKNDFDLKKVVSFLLNNPQLMVINKSVVQKVK
ncbi:3-deoxy-manno-octulosonate cytidylyltransferase, partial [Candidatus Woesearchaeota archaeon]|nr:3-deoxy-manno-octulosonate cytidylyltransferase [Candidatus Woesearchaeota archaeon]